jgi:hypothetical protein
LVFSKDHHLSTLFRLVTHDSSFGYDDNICGGARGAQPNTFGEEVVNGRGARTVLKLGARATKSGSSLRALTTLEEHLRRSLIKHVPLESMLRGPRAYRSTSGFSSIQYIQLLYIYIYCLLVMYSAT